MYIDLKSEIIELIERRAEGSYWDFKQQWHCKNTDLIHDIICMANSPANRDCFIIIGIDDKSYDICGVDRQGRKNQQNVIDLLRQKPKWAGGYVPEVYVKTIKITEQEIDVIIIKRSDNTPFYLLEDYKNDDGAPLFKGAIYTRKGDTNTPKTSTADLYDTEILWKRRLGLLYNPSQRAKIYLADLENWEMVDGETDKFGINRYFFYYKLDPDYTIHIIDDFDEEDGEIYNCTKDINDIEIGAKCYYLFSFCNVSYHTDFSNREKAVLYYKDIPLFSSFIECIDERRTRIIPPEFFTDPYYIKDSFHYLVFEFAFAHWCGNFSCEAKDMLLRVIPIYQNDSEHSEFEEYVKNKGFSYGQIFESSIRGEALTRFNSTKVEEYFDEPIATEHISKKLKDDRSLVINFAHPENTNYEEITKYLKFGKMLVDWLNEWRNEQS